MSAANPTPASTESPSLPAARQAGTVENTRAKARFTAGAPDLLQALVEAERFFDGSDDHGCPLHRKILAAIDTVKGDPA
ncbi:hypothetical protein B5P46_08145 [Rhizobium leguminosarum]|uniref:Uncharacterized protein n=1 Tax=Rhizobium leguminosarum TaxID=384 RepID=A0A4Q1UAY9_RHILE|nr:hypothetical protein [Rhizobium leguminosarum]RXT28733.1 hypothetical protein B5P46_08145 [Rhizobium leguminosarum]